MKGMLTAATEPHLLTVDEAAAKLRVSAVTAYRMIGRRELPAYKVGGQYRIDNAELLAWLRDQGIPGHK